MCLGCGKKRAKRKRNRFSCYPRLIEGLVTHIEEGCVHNYFQGAKDMKFTKYVNISDTMNRWWQKRQRAFVVYVSECGHRQWPIGGYWDLELMVCAMEGVFTRLIPQLVTHMDHGTVTVVPTVEPYGETFPF
eukprot:3135627-Amphidinium_carterae.3